MLRGDGNSLAAARFKILGPLGTGGFGAVYEALDTRSGQQVAVKELDDTSADSIARFKHEFRALADCHHENLVGLRELIEQNGRWLIVMELVPGTDFLRYVQRAANDNDERPGYDEARLRGALAGMAEGLRALHRFGIVHRDLKPSNVRVRPDGRAVLLDFGLATSVDPKQQSTHAMGVGTVVYMAPEQAGGESISPAVDLYALGVCLFEALTGRAPFDGDHAIKILLEKQRVEAPRASSIEPLVPTDLDELCAQLLAIDPLARPGAEHVLAVLNKTPSVTSLASPIAGAPEEVFAGREAELAHLERALARTHESELRIVLVEGESGVGKSELVSEFLRRMRSQSPRLLALRGRCYENEQVSYKAFDGCIDELGKVLKRMPEAELKALLPARAALLGQLFPVLRNIKAIASAARDGISADPSARRLEAFAALGHLLSKLAEERPVVLVIDDLQWADAESFRMLAALGQQTPRPPILLIGTVRPREELEPEVRDRLEEVRKWQHADVVALFGLPREQAKALARRLLPEGTPDSWLESIADESHGHPLFMSELIQYTESHDFATRGNLTLEAALRARIDRLDRKARELLEMVAVAARPHPLHVFASALSGNIEEAARALLRAKLLRQRRGQELGCYHDRIRHAAVDLVAKSRLPALHHQLAAALEKSPQMDPSEQAHHWDLAGQQERACGAYEDAAGKALETLAFTRAATLCGRALELLGSASDERVERLRIRRADALACSGRSAEAATLYQEAADEARGDARIKLRSRAAMHMILGANVGQGFAAARQLMQELGFRIPVGSNAGLLRYAWEALRVALSSKRSDTSEKVASTQELVALGVVREMLYTVGIINPLAYVVLAIQYVRRALVAGEPIHSALALTTRGWFRALHGSLPKALPLIELGRKLMEGQEEPLAIAQQAYAAGSAHTTAFDWVGAAEPMEQAQRIVQERCPDNPWLLTSIRYHLGGGWFHRGEHARLLEEMDGWLVEARERNDTFAVALLVGMGHGFARHLMRDAPEAALQELEASVAPIPATPYSFPHLGQLAGTMVSLLYQGGPAALRYLDAQEEKHAGAFLLKSATGRAVRGIFRAQASLAAYPTGEPDEQRLLLKSARRVAERLKRGRQPHLRGASAMVFAQLAALDGQRVQALAHAQEALAIFQAAGLVGRRAAKYFAGVLEGGRGGQEKCDSVIAEVKEAGWRDPLRALMITFPLLPLLSRAHHASLPNAQASSRLLLGRYDVTGQLGSGGFGTVVAARDVQSGRMVAIKELTRLGAGSIERFKQEFRALSELPHENIVQLDALFEHDRRWYIAMELLSGSDLVSYVRPSGELDAGRLRSALAGVARGLSALHQTGFVHRDVKTENVVVTSEGRAVLIDFGLCARAGDAREATCVGSLQYAAPEQLRGTVPAPPADVYALGACIFHTLSGQPAFAQSLEGPLAALQLRAQPEVPSPRGLEDVALLCRRMLADEPAARPTLAEVLELLSEERERTLDSVRPGLARAALPDRGETNFAGRAPELARLMQAFAQVETRGITLAIVEGESGLGKSELVRQLARRAQQEAPALQVLRARCYENEQVAFKAFDGAVDQLAQLLRALPKNECEALLPKRAALLAQLFPVLASVPAIAEAPKKGLPAEPAARKQVGRECFVQLLENVRARSPIMFVIDDLQWADAESFELLRCLTRRARALPLLITCTVRPATEIDATVAKELAELRALAPTEWLTLDALDETSALLLARQLLGTQIDEARLHELVAESKGHPLFLRELVEHEKSGLGQRPGQLTLDAALAARIERLSEDARRLLTFVALADKPYGVHVYARALELSEPSRDALVALLQQGLLRRRGDQLVCYHDRIRHAALAQLTAEGRKATARALACALSRELLSDAAERARLWDEACEIEQAVEAYEQAGSAALEALAFTRAQQHYARALELLGETERDPRFRRIMVARGHALVRAGCSADAARLFQRAAAHAEGEEAVRLRLWAAQHLLQGAQVDEGLRAASQLLKEVGLSLPGSDGAAQVRIAWERARVKLRGIALKQRTSSAREQLTLEVLHGLTLPVRGTSLLPGSALVVQYLRLALDAGQPVHAARALAYEGYWRTLSPSGRGAEALFEQSRTLAEATGEPALVAEVEVMRGVSNSNYFRFRTSAKHLWRAHDLLQSQCPGEPWLLTSARMYLGAAWTFSGTYAEILRHTGAWFEEAQARNDRYAMASITGLGGAALRHVMNEQPELALAEIETVMAPWPKEPFATNHYGAFLATANVLCTAPGSRLLRYLDANPQLETAGLMRKPIIRLSFLGMRLRGLLSTLADADSASTPQLLARVRKDLRELAALPGKIAKAYALAAQATLYHLEGNATDALRCAREAVAITEGMDHSCVSGCRYILAVLEGGESLHSFRAELRAQIEAEGWKDWRRGLMLRVPTQLTLLGD